MERKTRKFSTGSSNTSGYQTGSNPSSAHNTITPDNSQEPILPPGPSHKRERTNTRSLTKRGKVWYRGGLNLEEPLEEPNVPDAFENVVFQEDDACPCFSGCFNNARDCGIFGIHMKKQSR